jgi:amino acid adenylation domain-containing protein
MVPARYVTLETMPLTPSGKVDRRTLPEPGSERRELGRPYAAPGTAAELLLAQQWQKILRVEPIGVDDSFFDLGGDSIRSIQVVAQAREGGFAFSLQDLLAHPSIRQLAKSGEWIEPDTPVDGLTRPFELVPEADLERLPEGLEDAYPLTALQTGMLFHSQLDPETAVYHDVVSHHLRVALDPAGVEKALSQTVARHPVLRTSFELAAYSLPLQLVHRQVEVPIELEDLSDLSREEQDRAVAAWMEAEKKRGFDWRTAPILRVQLHRRGPEEFQFSLGFHHAILDGWSLASLLTELFQLYLTLIGQGESEVSARPEVTFRDYVALERDALESEQQSAFWDDQLAGFSPSLLPRLPGGRTGAAGVGERPVEIPAETSHGLKELASATGVPLKSVLLAAHLAALGAIVGEDEVVSGLVVNGRPEGVGSERVLGLFLNSLPFRQRLKPAPWRSLVREVFETERRMTPWRRFPMAELQRRAGNVPLFETAFNYTHFHVLEGVAGVGGVEVVGSFAFERTNFTLLAGFSLSLATSEIELRLTWDRGTLSANQVAAIGAVYRWVLGAMAAELGGPAEIGGALTAAERHLLVHEWNDSGSDLGEDAGLAAAFERIASRWPDRVAIVAGELQVTFAELARRGERLARSLRRRGVGPESTVGLLAERSLDLVTAVLATVRAGGAFVPFDPAYPDERIRTMAEDAGVRLLISDDLLSARAPEGIPRLLIGEPPAGGPPAPPPAGDLPAESLAYIMYTSGSTGRPKGVAVPQRAVLRLVKGGGFAELGPEEVFLLLAPLSFDASTLELWAPLLNGARLVLAPPDRLSLAELGREIERRRVSTLWLTAGLFHQMVDSEPGALGSLRQLLAGGDVLSKRRCDRVGRELPELTLINGYGPTENTTFTCCHRMRGPQPPGGSVPIGTPIAETRVVIVDRWLRPAPVGTPGELLTGGLGLARGYHRRPALTAASFIPDPHSERPGRRLYRTGDRARWLPDGRLEFLGRLDAQVKVRGFRIEPGEIEAALEAAPGVSRAAVVAWEPGEAEERRLAAYLVPKDGTRLAIDEIRRSLAARLPEYMLPAVFVELPELPLTDHGKVDRRALPAPSTEREAAESPYVAPSSPAEELLLELLGAELRVERIGMADDFFLLGGHSLTATRLAARLSDVFRIELPLRALFESPTAAGMVGELARMVGGRDLLDEVAELYRSVHGLTEVEVRAMLAESPEGPVAGNDGGRA